MPVYRYTEDDMAEAILDVTDNGLSQKKASQKWGIPQTSISARMRGQEAIEDQNQPKQRLTKSQESRLVTWILGQEACGYAPTHGQIKACVLALLR